MGGIPLLVLAPLTLAPDQVGADLSVAVSLDKGHELDPVSLSPDFWLGVGGNVTLGLIHSDWSVDRIAAGSSICVRREISEEPRPCDRAYHGANLDVRWATRLGPLEVVPRMRAMLRDIDPVKPAVAVGAIVRWTHGRIALVADPYLRTGLANTDQGNRTALVVPLYAGIEVGRWSFAFHTGYDSDLAVAADGFHVPAAIVVGLRATAHLELGLEGGLSSAFGPQNTSGYRAVIGVVSIRS